MEFKTNGVSNLRAWVKLYSTTHFSVKFVSLNAVKIFIFLQKLTLEMCPSIKLRPVYEGTLSMRSCSQGKK